MNRLCSLNPRMYGQGITYCILRRNLMGVQKWDHDIDNTRPDKTNMVKHNLSKFQVTKYI